MGLFDKFSIINLSKPKTYELNKPKTSPIIGGASTYKTLATFDILMDKPIQRRKRRILFLQPARRKEP